jgi:hypothetical protein
MYAPNLPGTIVHIFAAVAGALFSVIGFLIGVALLVVLVRFLLIGTRAARLYITNNSPAATPVAPSAPSPAATPTTTAAPKAPAPKTAVSTSTARKTTASAPRRRATPPSA